MSFKKYLDEEIENIAPERITKEVTITLNQKDWDLVWDALYGRRASYLRSSQDDSTKEKILKYNSIIKVLEDAGATT